MQKQANDFIVDCKAKVFEKRYFMIKHCNVRKAYLLKDLEYGTGTFIKVSPRCVLKNNSIISFGDIHFCVSIMAQFNSASTKVLYFPA